jgi:class 3 adenylate cyclase
MPPVAGGWHCSGFSEGGPISVLFAATCPQRVRALVLLGTFASGVLATFDGPTRALECATALAERIPELGIDIRCGVHTGECEIRGDDIGGIAVHIGARIAALARAGEVLVSSTVKDLVNGSEMAFQDRGTHVLKGVPGEWRLFAPVDARQRSPAKV